MALLVATVATGCDRNEVQVYKTAKETPKSASAHEGHAHAEPSVPRLTYTVPTGWEEAPPGEMRAASFRVKGAGDKTADVGVVPLPGMAGSDLNNVNRWRGQVGLEPVTEEELAKIAQPVPMEGLTAKLFDVSGENPGSGDKTRLIAAILRKDGVAWFFKMMGDEAVVGQSKPAFIEFLKSVKFPAVAAAPAELPPSHPPLQTGASPGMAPAAGSGSSKTPAWQVPAGWKEAPAGQFLVAKFTIPGSEPATAVNVSMSVGDGGGLAGNVNRWRRQVGLDEVPEAQLSGLVSTLDVQGGKASLVEMAGKDPRNEAPVKVIGVIVPRPGQTWFYKLMGPGATVDQQAAAFKSFVQSAKYD